MTLLPFATDRAVREAVPRALAHLAAGGLLGHPTETVYGIGGRATDTDLAAVAALKARDATKPVLLLVEGVPMIERLGLRVEGAARRLAEAFWPGPLTLVLPGGDASLPAALRGPTGGIAVRWTSHPGMRALLGEWDQPLTSTSANLAGGRTPTAAADLRTLFAEAAAAGRLLVLDGGVLPGAPSSTVVDCTGGSARIAREGAVARGAIESVIGSTAS